MNIFRTDEDLDFVLRKYVMKVDKLMHDKHGASVVYAGHNERSDGSVEVFMLPIMSRQTFRPQEFSNIVLDKNQLIRIAKENNVPIATGNSKTV